MTLLQKFMRNYSVNVKCNNCNHKFALNIPKGITTKDYVPDAECASCGCCELECLNDISPKKVKLLFPRNFIKKKPEEDKADD